MHANMENLKLVKQETNSEEKDDIEVKIENYPIDTEPWQYQTSIDSGMADYAISHNVCDRRLRSSVAREYTNDSEPKDPAKGTSSTNLNTERSQSSESLDSLGIANHKGKSLHKESNLISITCRLPSQLEGLTISWKSKPKFKSPRKQRLLVKRASSSSSTVSCPFCFEDFTDKAKFSEHYRRHTDKNAFTCPNCSKLCKFRSELKRHIKSHSRAFLRPFKV